MGTFVQVHYDEAQKNTVPHNGHPEVAAEALRATEANEPDDIYATLKARLPNTHGISIKRRTTEEMTQALRVYDKENRVIYVSEALDYSNVIFQLAHVMCLIELQDLLNKLTSANKINVGTSLARCHVELANYFAAAFLMPYEPFLREAESMGYDIDHLAARFGSEANVLFTSKHDTLQSQ